MSTSLEQRVRQVLNLIWLSERCLALPRSSPAERAQWAAEIERARRELASIDPPPDLPDDLARALARAREPGSRPAQRAGFRGSAVAYAAHTHRSLR